MAKQDRTILVTGATGWQGGAVARQLLAEGWQVRALTRDPDRPGDGELRAAGALHVPGDLDDRPRLDAAMTDVYGVFSVQPSSGSDLPPDFRWEDELRWGTNTADAAARAGVSAFVYSSANGADNPDGLPVLDVKAAIERHIAALGLPATVIGPTSFMENFARPRIGLRDGRLKTFLAPDVPQQLIAVADIAAFAVLAFTEPDRYRGLSIDIAGDDLTPPQTAAAMSTALGTEIEYERVTLNDLQARSENVARGFNWLNSRSMKLADIPALRLLHPGLMDFASWLSKGGGTDLLARHLADAAVSQ